MRGGLNIVAAGSRSYNSPGVNLNATWYNILKQGKELNGVLTALEGRAVRKMCREEACIGGGGDFATGYFKRSP
jgi:hypothetical protein